MGFMDRMKRAAADSLIKGKLDRLRDNKAEIVVRRRPSLTEDGVGPLSAWTYEFYRGSTRLGRYNPAVAFEDGSVAAGVVTGEQRESAFAGVEREALAAMTGGDREEEYLPGVKDGKIGYVRKGPKRVP